MVAPNAPPEIHEEEHKLVHGDPEVNSWFCIAFLLATIAVMAVTAEMVRSSAIFKTLFCWTRLTPIIQLVESIEFVREQNGITEEWFGLILLPIVSFSADGVVAIMYFIRTALFLKPENPPSIAKARAIDLSIQFTLFWMPFLILLSWWTNKPLTLLFGNGYFSFSLNPHFPMNRACRFLRSSSCPGGMLLGELRHSRCEDKLGRRIHNGLILFHDREYHQEGLRLNIRLTLLQRLCAAGSIQGRNR